MIAKRIATGQETGEPAGFLGIRGKGRLAQVGVDNQNPAA